MLISVNETDNFQFKFMQLVHLTSMHGMTEWISLIYADFNTLSLMKSNIVYSCAKN